MKEKDGTNRLTWAIVAGIPISFLVWGLIVFYTIGVKWPPSWDYGAIQDVPGKSPYSTSNAKQFLNYDSRLLQPKGGAAPQHVKGPRSEPDIFSEETKP